VNASLSQRLADDLRWFREHLDPPPERMHERGVRHDGSGGSRLGSPALRAEFTSWLFAEPRSTRASRVTEQCYHPQSVAGPCPDCGGSGSITRDRGIYRNPMAAAISTLKGIGVDVTRPRYDITAAALARTGGSIEAAIEILLNVRNAGGDGPRWPLMTNRHAAYKHVARTLRKLRQRYRRAPLVSVVSRGIDPGRSWPHGWPRSGPLERRASTAASCVVS
jgi:hypothetical protein